MIARMLIQYHQYFRRDDDMKRILCAVMAMILIFSFAGCSKKEVQNIKDDAPKIGDINISEKYKSSGKVSFVINGKLPEIKKGCDEHIASLINRIIEEYLDEQKLFAESNADNAKNFMEMNSTESPWTRTFDYEVTYADSKIICILVKNSFSLDGGEPSVSYKTFCFELENGRRFSALDFSTETEEPLRDDMTRFITYDVKKKLLIDGEEPTAEQLSNISSLIDFNNFYIDEENVCFYFAKAGIDSSLFGLYTAVLPFEKIFNYFIKPSELFNQNEE